MTHYELCIYHECTLKERYGRECCTQDYENCPTYQTWKEEEDKIVKMIGISTKEWEKSLGYGDNRENGF